MADGEQYEGDLQGGDLELEGGAEDMVDAQAVRRRRAGAPGRAWER